MDSAYAASMIPDGSVDMVFIDSDHRYEQVKAEIERWLPKATGIICGHDYMDCWPGVKQAVEEAFPKFHVKDSIWFHILNEKGDHDGTTDAGHGGNGSSEQSREPVGVAAQAEGSGAEG